MINAFGWSTDVVLELLLVDALATRLPKFEPESIFLMVKMEGQFKPTCDLAQHNPLFLLSTDKSGKVQKPSIWGYFEAILKAGDSYQNPTYLLKPYKKQ
ncbi:hypothetical protein [Polynucleobacter necessarius]|uniref:hypothetical protein n=1 Tax=Polynucleobacter necessarius TaxID=576610 RepID=UPI001E2DE484|nr:hypothetical protein [Polynucleobacter necessarius]